MISSKQVFTVMALGVFLLSAALAAAAQGSAPTIDLSGVLGQLNVVFMTGPKGTQTANVTVNSNGPVTIPPTLAPPDDPNAAMRYKKCKDGELYIYVASGKDPCPGVAWWGSFNWNTPGRVVLDTAQSMAMTHGGGGGGGAANNAGGLHPWVMLDIEPGFTRWGAFPGAFASTCSSDPAYTCTHDTTTFKLAVLGSILFGDGWFSAGPVGGYEHHNSLNSALSSSGEGGMYEETEGIRDNTTLIGVRESLGFGMQKHFRINFDEMDGLHSFHFRDVETSVSDDTSSTSIYEDSTTLNSPVVGVSFLYIPSAHLGFSVGYRYSAIRFERCFNCDAPAYEEELHDNDVVFDLTFVFGRPKD